MRTKRILTRGGFVESPTNTYTLTPDADTTIETGLTEFKIVATTDDSYIADLTITFLAQNVAEDFKANALGFLLCGDYGEKASDLPNPVGGVFTDSIIAPNAETYASFLKQLKHDLSLELILGLPHYK